MSDHFNKCPLHIPLDRTYCGQCVEDIVKGRANEQQARIDALIKALNEINDYRCTEQSTADTCAMQIIADLALDQLKKDL